jgi:hypothetical protein
MTFNTNPYQHRTLENLQQCYTLAVELSCTAIWGWRDMGHGGEPLTGASPTSFSNLLGLLPGYNDTLGNIIRPNSIS